MADHRSERFLRMREGLLLRLIDLKEGHGDADLTPDDGVEYDDYWRTKKKLRNVRRELHIIGCDDCLAAELVLEAHAEDTP